MVVTYGMWVPKLVALKGGVGKQIAVFVLKVAGWRKSKQALPDDAFRDLSVCGGKSLQSTKSVGHPAWPSSVSHVQPDELRLTLASSYSLSSRNTLQNAIGS